MSTLSPNSTQYLRSDIESQQLHDVGGNRVDLELETGVSVVTQATRPEVRTTGNTVVYFTGKCEVTGTPTVDMPLLKFPQGFLPHNISQRSVTQQVAAVSTVVPISIHSTGISAIGTPDANTIYHLESIGTYLSRFGG